MWSTLSENARTPHSCHQKVTRSWLGCFMWIVLYKNHKGTLCKIYTLTFDFTKKPPRKMCSRIYVWNSCQTNAKAPNKKYALSSVWGILCWLKWTFLEPVYLLDFSLKRVYGEKPRCCVTSSKYVNVRVNYPVNIGKWFILTRSGLVMHMWWNKSLVWIRLAKNKRIYPVHFELSRSHNLYGVWQTACGFDMKLYYTPHSSGQGA